MPDDTVRDSEGGGKWTPGPWRIKEWRIKEGPRHAPDCCDLTICGDIFMLVDITGPNYAHCEANARLIAAAPAMAEALRGTTAALVAAISLLERGGKKAAPSDTMFGMMLADYRRAVEEARAALALAEGDAP